MSRRGGIIFGCCFLAASLYADDAALWREYGLVRTETAKRANFTVTTYQMKDATGALAAWEWQRSEQGRRCNWTAFCTDEGKRIVVNDDNYIVVFDGARPNK